MRVVLPVGIPVPFSGWDVRKKPLPSNACFMYLVPWPCCNMWHCSAKERRWGMRLGMEGEGEGMEGGGEGAQKLPNN